MKRIVRCARCSFAASRLPAGFTSVPVLHCTAIGRDVEQDDGCTFGAKGEPSTATDAPEVDISARAAVDGWRYE